METITRKKLAFGILGVAVAVAISFIKPPAPLDEKGMVYLGLLFCFIIWMSSAVMPEFMCGLATLVAAILCGLCTVKEAFAPFAGETTWLLIGAFAFGYCINKTGLLKRIAFSVMQFFPMSYFGQMLALYSAGTVVSPLMPSLTVKATVMCALCIPASEAFGFERNSRGAAGLFMSSYWSSAIFGNFFYTGCVFVMLMCTCASAELQAQLNTFTWFKFFWPFFAVFFVGGLLFISQLYTPKNYTPLLKTFIKDKLKTLGPMSRNEKITGALFILTLLGWLTSSYTGISNATCSIAGLSLLTLCGQFNSVDYSASEPWAIITLIAAITSISSLIQVFGIDIWLGEILTALLGPITTQPVLILVCECLAAFLLRWVIPSQLASAPLVYALFVDMAGRAGINSLVVVFVAYLGIQCWPIAGFCTTMVAGLGSTLGFVEYKTVSKMSFVYSVLVLVATLANIPVWRLCGLM